MDITQAQLNAAGAAASEAYTNTLGFRNDDGTRKDHLAAGRAALDLLKPVLLADPLAAELVNAYRAYTKEGSVLPASMMAAYVKGYRDAITNRRNDPVIDPAYQAIRAKYPWNSATITDIVALVDQARKGGN